VKKRKLLIILALVIMLTGCTKTLTDPETKKTVVNEVTGQSLTQNILCKPTNKEMIEIYEQYSDIVNIEKLPACSNFKITSGGYEGLWTTFFVKPLAYVILKCGKMAKSYGLALVIISLLIRAVLYPVTKKTALQSELINKARPELDKLEVKYANKKDQDSMMKKSQEMTMIYKKYNINPLLGCLYAFIQLPLFIAFLEAINRVPAIFEETFIKFQMGTTPMTGISNGKYIYIALILVVAITTYYSTKLNSTSTSQNNGMDMSKVMVITITFMSLFMSSALNVYWITTNVFTIVQNLLVKRSKVLNEKV